MSDHNYILEFKPQGRYVKVTAIDPVSGVEAVIVGDIREHEAVLTRHAIQKLQFLLSK